MIENQQVYRDVLNEGHTLHWYEVKSVLGRGSFGVTYLAQDKNLDQLVAIKEYFPRDFSSRASGSTVHPTTGEKQELYEWGLVRFVREAQTLAKFKHPNIVRVMSVFELNNTAYMVMEYEQGEELSRVYKRQGSLSEQELLAIFIPIMDGLKLVHDAGFIHRDIKPSNIFIRADGSPVLIDFGAARQTIGTPTRTVTSLVSYGYAPFEQYNEGDEKQGAWTDIFALGACLYSAVVGKLPVDALARGSSLLSNGVDPYQPASVLKKDNYSPGFLRAIDHALMFHAQDRPQDIIVWADMLSGKIEAPPIATEMFRPPGAESDEDATVVMTTPPGVSSRHRKPSLPPTTPLTTPPAAPATTSESGSDVSKLVGPWNTKVIGSVIAVLLLVTVGAIFVFWEGGAPIDNEKVEQTTEKEETKETDTQQKLAALLQRADEAYKAGKMLDKDGGAIYLYQQILKTDPSNTEAAKRIQEIIELNSDGIRSDLAEGFVEKAQSKFQLLQDAVPDSKVVLALQKDVQDATANNNNISRLLEQAAADFEAGRLTSPESQNALSKYRQILELAPDNADAKRGIENITAHYVAQAEKNLAKSKVADVESNIDDILSIDPDSAAVKELRRDLRALEARNKHQREVNQLLSQARRAYDAGNLTKPANKSALVLYQRVLKLDRGNTTAKQGIKNVEQKLESLFNKYLTAGDFKSAESVLTNVEDVMPKSKVARDMRAEWEQSKPGSRPDIEIISEMIGKFKQAFESRNSNALQKLSEYQANRQDFLHQLFSNYTSFKVGISDVKFIGRERKGTANIAVKDLVNIQGASVEPGAWSKFQIVIRRNTKGQWKIYW